MHAVNIVQTANIEKKFVVYDTARTARTRMCVCLCACVCVSECVNECVYACVGVWAFVCV